MSAFAPNAVTPNAALPVTGFIVVGVLPAIETQYGSYSSPYIAIGGNAPYTYSATGLPTGLSINASTGVVSGAVTTPGTFNVIVTATDITSATASTPSQTVVVQVMPSWMAQLDWPNPQIPRRSHVGFAQGMPLTLYQTLFSSYNASSKFLGYAIEGPPVGVAVSSKLLGYVILGPSVTVPFDQLDWPNPLIKPYPTDLRTWISTPPISFIPLPPPFIAQDISLIQRPLWRPPDASQSSNFNLIGIPTFTVSNPPLLRRTYSDLSFLTETPLTLLIRTSDDDIVVSIVW